MLTRLPRILIALALACSIGLHWTFLQSLAWVGMVVTYSRGATLPVAIEKTFDGKHPCTLCKQIAQGKKSEKKQDIQIEARQLTFLNPDEPFVFFAPHRFHLLGMLDEVAFKLAEQPPVPPPRLA